VERNQIREHALAEANEANRLRDADHDKLVSDLRRQIDDLKRKSDQGSQQLQGEVMEVELRDALAQSFPMDTIEEVTPGCAGGDILQHVHDANGRLCGSILWESKRTKAWTDTWLPKLRDDQRQAKAHIAAILTAQLPRSIANFGCLEGVWVTNRACAIGLAAALRAVLIEAARSARSAEGVQTKMETLYDYLAGPQFRQRVEAIVEAFTTMRKDLDSERRSFSRIWSKREKQLSRAMVHAAGLYGDIGGIIGSSLPRLEALELTAVEADGSMLDTVIDE
jgi:hypothetical protein